jgi:hypothetical protein
MLPPEVRIEVLRDYGQTANEKVNELSSSLALAIITVVVFIGVFLGVREALVVSLAVPICYGFTLALDLAFGYTINRVTLFALILSLGLLVDDPITGVDNIERYLRRKGSDFHDLIIAAITEIRAPLVMSTVTIVLAFIPLGFITGMMGPYMAPWRSMPISVMVSAWWHLWSHRGWPADSQTTRGSPHGTMGRFAPVAALPANTGPHPAPAPIAGSGGVLVLFWQLAACVCLVPLKRSLIARMKSDRDGCAGKQAWRTPRRSRRKQLALQPEVRARLFAVAGQF